MLLRSKNIKMVDLLLKYNAKVDMKTSGGITALQIAVENNDQEIASSILLHHVNVNTIDEDGNSPLLLALKNHNTKIIKILLAHGANVNMTKKEEDWPLLIAAKNNNIEIITMLLNHGANVNPTAQMEMNRTAWEYSPWRNSHNPYPYEESEIVLNTPLLIAVKNNNIKIIKMLLNHGADIETRNKDGESPLSVAIQKNKIELIEMLLKNKSPFITLEALSYANNNPVLMQSLENRLAKYIDKDDEFILKNYKLFIMAGDNKYAEPLIEVLNKYGNKRMTEDYCNSNNDVLANAAKNWAHKHGYQVQNVPSVDLRGPLSQRGPKWGN